MTKVKMHENEIETDENLVRRLLKKQFPQWAHLTVKAVPSSGTDNALYRLGRDKLVRLPRIDWAVGQVEKEHIWLPKLAQYLPLQIPNPIAMGNSDEDYPWKWSIYHWIDGENSTIAKITNPIQVANDLAQFIIALQEIDLKEDLSSLTNQIRGKPLSFMNSSTRKAIAKMRGLIDTELATEIWEKALQAPEWTKDPVLFHGDLLPGNLIFENKQLKAVIDFGGLGVGDPSCDLMIAWSLFTAKSREAFRRALHIDDATWARGRGRALSQAMIFIPYYLRTNPIGVKTARHALDEIFRDHRNSC